MSTDIIKTRNDITLDEIEELMRKEKDIKVYKKLFYVRFRIMGYTKIESYTLANIKKSTAYNIEDQWNENGYQGLLPKKRKTGSGRKPKLNIKQRNELYKILIEEEDLTIHDIQKIIEDKYNKKYTYMGVKKLIENQFNLDIEDYLDYTPKFNLKKENIEKNLDNIDSEDEKELEQIINYIRTEKDVFIYRKLLFLLFTKLNYPLEFTSTILGVTEDTLITWFQQWNKNGYESLKKKSGQGRKSKLSDENWEEIRKIMSTRNDWTLPEISYIIETKYGVKYSLPHLAKLLKKKLNAHFAKPYSKDYRQSPYYKQSFHLKLNHIFKKYKLQYDINTGNIINKETNEPFHIFSYDESSFQFTPNNVKFWALIKPMVKKDTTIFKCKAMGAYALTPNSNDYLEFVENQKSETLIKYLENLRNKNPEGVMLLLIDNFTAHKTDDVLEKAKELNIELCFLPTYSPQLQPIEKVWKENKRQVALFKINSVKDYKDLTKKERQSILEEIITESFYEVVKSKNKWNKVLNNFILPKIKLYSPEFNTNWEVQKV